MNTTAAEIAEIVGDYRSHDGISISKEHVMEWVEQFDADDRGFVLSETLAILKERYVPLEDAKRFVTNALKKMAKDYKYDSVPAFLDDTYFLDLQEPGKSQKELLKLVGSVAEEEYGHELNEKDARSASNIIYVDDVLCTGNNLFFDMKAWLAEEHNGTTNLQHVKNGDQRLLLLYLFAHNLNFHKVNARFRHEFKMRLPVTCWSAVWVENNYDTAGAKLDFVFPIKEGLSARALEYLDALGDVKTGVLRDPNLPHEDCLFSSRKNRTRLEHLFLEKGLEILDSVSVQKENIRPLGFTLPSQKSFGFGALCFTWRNVPNNTPLVFWYSSSHWTPLFEKKERDAASDFAEYFGS